MEQDQLPRLEKDRLCNRQTRMGDLATVGEAAFVTVSHQASSAIRLMAEIRSTMCMSGISGTCREFADPQTAFLSCNHSERSLREYVLRYGVDGRIDEF